MANLHAHYGIHTIRVVKDDGQSSTISLPFTDYLKLLMSTPDKKARRVAINEASAEFDRNGRPGMRSPYVRKALATRNLLG